MKKRLWGGLIACVIILIGLCTFAQADYIPVKIEVSVSPTSMSGPKDVTVKIKVSNIADDDLPGNVSVQGPDGATVTEFGDGGSTPLKQGATSSCETTYKVTQADLNKGKLTYSVKYPIYNDDGELVKKSISTSIKISKSTAAPEVNIKRTISPSMAKKGQEVIVSYEIENAGNVTLEDIKITEHKNISSKAANIKKLEPGQMGEVNFKVTMGTKDLTSECKITYKVAGASKTYTKKEAATKIVYGQPKIETKLTASAKAVKIDESVKLKLTLTNAGNADYDNVRVTDPTLGEVFTNERLPANGKLELEKEVTLRQNTDFVFTIEAADASGNVTTVDTSKVSVAAVDPSAVLELTIAATANTEVIYEQPGLVTFTVTVENPSNVDAKEVKITCGNSKTLYTFDEIKAGEKRSFKRDVAATQAGQFQFTATTKDALENSATFMSNTIAIGFTQPTAEPTTAPTLPAPTKQVVDIPTSVKVSPALSIIRTIMSTLGIVLGIVLAISIGLLAVATLRRMKAKRESENAYDHLERAARRDYSQEPKHRDEKTEAEKTLDETDDIADEAPDDKAMRNDKPNQAIDDDLFSISFDDEAEPTFNESDADDLDMPIENDDGAQQSAMPNIDLDTPTTASAQDFSRRRRSRSNPTDTDVNV